MYDPVQIAHHVVIIGGGFGGLYAARNLRRDPVRVTLIDRQNFHLFQPLLYQVATGALSPANIAAPLRALLRRQKNTTVLLGSVTGIDPTGRRVTLENSEIVGYDTLIVATGVRHFYFGHDEWENAAPGLKTIEDATHIRRQILLAFEQAEREPDPQRQREILTFVVVGGGPTGVEMAGAIAEIANYTLRGNFRRIDPSQATIVLIEGADRVLPTYPPPLSAKARADLERMGVKVRTKATVTHITDDTVTFKENDAEQTLRAHTTLWAAGVQASGLGKILQEATGVELDRAGRVMVEADCTVRNHPEIFVIGDLAHFAHQTGKPLPGVAQVAMQQGKYAARLIIARLEGRTLPPFHYRDLGNMATIGRASAVADLGRLQLTGFLGWAAWLFIHLINLVQFQNRVLVVTQWAWNYVTRNRAARLITGETAQPVKEIAPS
jgi:NADH:ubiquinone reductase (H+-translocating)